MKKIILNISYLWLDANHISRAGNVASSSFGKVSDNALLCGFSAHWHGVLPVWEPCFGLPYVSFSVKFLETCWQHRFQHFWKSFRRHVRHFFGASLWLLRPALAWSFPVRELCFGLPCLLVGVIFAAVLATSEGFQTMR